VIRARAASSTDRIARHHGTKIRPVAVARQVVTLSLYGLHDGEIRFLAKQPAHDLDELPLALFEPTGTA
jgi:hypothetical protein